jgi:hypothetical protein
MADRMRRFEDLAVIEINSTSSLRQWTTVAREVEQAMGWEMNFAGNVITGALRPLPVVGVDEGWLRGEVNSAVVARRIGSCFQRAAEHHIGAAKVLTKAYTLFEINYLEERAKTSKPAFRLND